MEKNLSHIYNQLVELYGNQAGEMVDMFSDKGSMHSYIEVYEQKFKSKQSKASLLEIGVMTGGSMLLWRNYFESYDLWAVDLRSGWNQHRPFQADLVSDSNCHLVWNIDSTSQIPDAITGKKFDFIIDDGDHQVLSQMATFSGYWPLLELTGCYFIEDIIGSVQLQILQNFLSSYHDPLGYKLKVEHYGGFKNGRQDDQMLMITRSFV